jgi:predicted CoA-binding protein
MSNLCELPRKNASSNEIGEILFRYKTVAIVGISDKEDRDSYIVGKYLIENGYTVIPVNPNITEFMGIKAYPSLLEIPGTVDVVDIFRKPEAVPEIVEHAIKKGAKVIWMQKGIVNNAAAENARAHGLKVVMDRCMMVEHRARKATGNNSNSP